MRFLEASIEKIRVAPRSVTVALTVKFINRRDKRQKEASLRRLDEEQARDELRRKQDRQLNVGNRILNALEKAFEPYRDLGVRVYRANAHRVDAYDIHVEHRHNHTMHGFDPLMQIGVSYAGNDTVGYETHPLYIHRGAYGYSFWAKGEDEYVTMVIRHVVEEVTREAERLKKALVSVG